ncbi:MAG: hypothetical protein U0936_17990 [Planctomycetaceae bacterium]
MRRGVYGFLHQHDEEPRGAEAIEPPGRARWRGGSKNSYGRAVDGLIGVPYTPSANRRLFDSGM